MERLTPLLVATIVVVAGSTFMADHIGSLYDDAYIYFRYADNLVAGCGFRFNCSADPVEGFTSPLFLLLVTGVRLLTTDLEWGVSLMGAGLLLGMLGVCAALPRGLLTGRPAAAACVLSALVLAADDHVLANGPSGMETSLGIAAVAGLWLAILSRAPLATGLLLPIAILSRPETGVFLLVLVLPWARTARCLAPAGVGLAAMGLWRLVVFGELVPNTFAAKSGGTSLHLEHGLSYVGEALVEYPLALLAPLALLLARKRELAVLGAATAVWVAFVVRAGGDHFSYSRLLAPVLIPASMLAVAGLTSLAVSRGRLWLAAVPILPFAAWTHTDKDLAPEHGFANVAQWVDVGRWIAAERPGSTAATVPIGAIGWFCECELIDLVGLTEPAIAHAGRSVPEELFVPQWIGHERHNTEYVLSREPDLIVTNKWRLEPWTLEESRAGFYASWLLLQEVKEGRAPYRVLNAEVAEGVYWLLLERDPH